jgi:hypothetical protein
MIKSQPTVMSQSTHNVMEKRVAMYDVFLIAEECFC